MKKIFLALLFSSLLFSCSDDSESDISTPSLTENNDSKDENNDDKKMEETTAKITFTKDILPIIKSKCNNCHTGGNETNYTSFTASKNRIDNIIDRINREQGDPSFMPRNRTKLSTSDLAKFSQWVTDGLLE